MMDKARYSRLERADQHGRQDYFHQPENNSQRIAQLLNERRLRKAAQNQGCGLEVNHASAAPPVEVFHGRHHYQHSHYGQASYNARQRHNLGQKVENYYARHAAGNSDRTYASGVVEHGISNRFHNALYQGYYSNPRHVRESLIKGNYKIIATEDISAYDTRYKRNFATIHPPGYEAGKTYKAAVGLCDHNSKHVIMPEYYEPQGKRVAAQDKRDIPGVLRHEVGHAFDFLNRARLRDNPEVQRLYEEGKKKLIGAGALRPKQAGYNYTPTYDSPMVETSPVKSLKYYLEPGSGLGETIAELYAIRHGGGCDSKNNDRLLASHFSKLLDYMRRNNI